MGFFDSFFFVFHSENARHASPLWTWDQARLPCTMPSTTVSLSVVISSGWQKGGREKMWLKCEGYLIFSITYEFNCSILLYLVVFPGRQRAELKPTKISLGLANGK